MPRASAHFHTILRPFITRSCGQFNSGHCVNNLCLNRLRLRKKVRLSAINNLFRSSLADIISALSNVLPRSARTAIQIHQKGAVAASAAIPAFCTCRYRQLAYLPVLPDAAPLLPHMPPPHRTITTEEFKQKQSGCKRTIITRTEQSYGRVLLAGLCRSFISVYVPGAGLPGARASAFPAPHGSEICPDRAAYSAPAIDTHKAQCRWPWPFPPANTQWHWIPLP